MTDTVYFIEGGGLIKIGFSSVPKNRLAALRTASSVPVKLIGTVAGSRSQEQKLHALVADKRVRGEWFTDCADVRALVQRCLTGGLEFLGEDEATEPLDPVIQEARRIAQAIAKYSFVICEGQTEQRLKQIEPRYGIAPGTIWRLCYRPADLGTHSYVRLLTGARAFFRDLSAAIDREAAGVASIMDGHAKRESKSAEMDAALGLPKQCASLTAAFAE